MQEEATAPVKRKMIDLATVNVVLKFRDGGGFVVPLTDLQGAFLARMMGFRLTEEGTNIDHYTDKQLNEIYHLFPDEKKTTETGETKK